MSARWWASLGHLRRRACSLVAPVVLCCALLLPGMAMAAPGHSRRIAVVVGSNDAPPGRARLRFAHEDARSVADALRRVGQFASSDVQLLLDPAPDDIDRALERARQAVATADGDVLFLFYYSGHSDGEALFPGGAALPLATLRRQLATIGGRVQVDILDVCRGGSWTQSKGLSLGPPITQANLLPVASEGTVLLSSSSGFENAHEAEELQSSFFTHHLVAGMLGAADRDADSRVTLQEAFEYAKERTVRDSARLSPTTQHPSFDVHLRGRQDLVLARLIDANSTLEVSQTQGPLEVIELASGITIADLATGPRSARLALAPGRYLVRKVAGGRAFVREIDIRPAGSTAVSEGQLQVTAGERLALKGAGDVEMLPLPQWSTLPKGKWQLGLALGTTTGAASPARIRDSATYGSANGERRFAGQLSILYGITDRLTWFLPYPALAYRFGARGGTEFIPDLAVADFGYNDREGVTGDVVAGATLRRWTAANQSILVAAHAATPWSIRVSDGQLPSDSFATWLGTLWLGYTWSLRGVVSLSPGVGWTESNASRQPNERSFVADGSASLNFGSSSLAFRRLPLVEVHVSAHWSLDLYAAVSVNLRRGTVQDVELAGVTWNP